MNAERTVAWEQAVEQYHREHITCEMCGTTGYTLGPLDGPTVQQDWLEAHDVLPFHLMTSEQQNSIEFIKSNLIVLHHFEHHRIAHGGDPSCYQFNPDIRAVAATVLAARSKLTR